MTNKISNIVVGVLLAGVAAAGCGGSSGGGSCGAQPCGGDVVGNWSIDEVCLAPGAFSSMVPASLAASCPSATISPIDLDTSGSSMVFGADMTFQMQITLLGSAVLTIPASCIPGVTCAQLNALIALELASNPDPSVQSITCSGASSCACTIVATPQSNATAGTYTTSGNTLTTTVTGGAPEAIDYCVTGGNTLVLREPPVSMGGMMSEVLGLVGHK